MNGSVTAFGSSGQKVLALLERARSELTGTEYSERVSTISSRLEGPLRVAIAGRVKSGKSTLLNALVGERLAPTDAGECTKIVSWYRRGSGYEVAAILNDGTRRPVTFQRNAGALDIQLAGLTERDVRSLDVAWPTSALADYTLIDTPGLASINDDNSRRTRDFLEIESDRSSDADAVIYLMRHVHKADVDFLDAFMDRSVAAASPVNAVAVLSRSDEIGAGRLDAMDSAARIAERYRNDQTIRTLCANVVPLAGLLAETGLTLREEEATSLRTLSRTDDDELSTMLLSPDHFCDLHASDLTVEIRRELLSRLGMFGVRVALDEMTKGASSAATLGPRLVEVSGLDRLKGVISDHFLPRARTLQARSALVSVRSLARDLRADGRGGTADWIDREAEQIEASGVEFARVRAGHLVSAGLVALSETDRAALEPLLMAGDPASVLASGGGADAARRGALEGIERWRTRAEDPLAAPQLREVCETAVRVCEAVYSSG